jgi:hypothetical protein
MPHTRTRAGVWSIDAYSQGAAMTDLDIAALKAATGLG